MQGKVSRTSAVGIIHCLSTQTCPVSEHTPATKRHVPELRQIFVLHSSKSSQSELLLHCANGLSVGEVVGELVGISGGVFVGALMGTLFCFSVGDAVAGLLVKAFSVTNVPGVKHPLIVFKSSEDSKMKLLPP